MAVQPSTQDQDSIQELFKLVRELKQEFLLFIQAQAEVNKKTDQLYITVVKGNGDEPLRYTVKAHDQWIERANKIFWFVVFLVISELIITSFSMAMLFIWLLGQQQIPLP